MSVSSPRFNALVNEDRLLLISIALFAFVYVCFYPQLYTSIDEASTFRMAFILRHGTIFPHDNGFFPSISPLSPHGRVYRFLIGFPAVLAAASLFGWRALFLVNPALHIIAAWLFSRVLRAAQIPPVLAVLYLFYPSSVLFSRSLFSDIFAASLTTIALYFLLPGKKPLIAGLFLGLALASRSASLLVAIIVAVFLAIDDLKFNRRTLYHSRAVAFVAGLVPFILLNMAYNDAIYGSPFQSTYTAGELSIANIRYNGPIYALSLGLIYPGMILAPLFYRGWYWKPALVSSVLTLLLAAAFEETTYGNNLLQNFLSAPRQVLPAMPFFLLAFCGVLARWLPISLTRRSTHYGCSCRYPVRGHYWNFSPAPKIPASSCRHTKANRGDAAKKQRHLCQ